MCGRYASFLPAAAIARLFRTVNPLPNVAPSWNVAGVEFIAENGGGAGVRLRKAKR